MAMRLATLLPIALLAACSAQRAQLGQALSGKPPVLVGSLAGAWQIADLNGGGPVAGSTLAFDPGDQGRGQLRGTTGCNQFRANWTPAGAIGQFGPFAATKMACAPPLQEVEQRVLALLVVVNSVVYTTDGAAILATRDGRKLRLTRLPKG